ncbi:DUF1289 domain-containing protein [Acidovorax sp. Leaf78]|uniref:DUF1289 domain-containing protein n=1 Tax=Acidovorax sp. Leaf78 TaxID=1736237 RepID=UPI0006F56E81|nr:DUF1289 domain-containing protein [Acidovorax sp. Leaf78]KQO27131.1 hypothetical protein ASF16_19150 [Acidovorax sp. Leaf78]
MNAIDLLAIRARQASGSGYFDSKSQEVVPSPCISVCRLSLDHTHCEGCFRTLDEIRIWSGADSDTRRRIWAGLLGRAGITLTAPPPQSTPSAQETTP